MTAKDVKWTLDTMRDGSLNTIKGAAYKLVDGDTWSLDPTNPAFAYDDFAGNPDGKNSVLDTPDSQFC